jgi:parvulin-like peptidyl-prolyl isomerase
MRFRMWLFSILALLSLGWIALGFSATSQVVSDISKTAVPTSQYLSPEDAKAARDVGTAIGSTMSLGVFLCTGLPLLIVSSLLAWRNQVGIRSEKRHKEQIALQQQQVDAARQMAMSQVAQAQMQFGNVGNIQQQLDAAKALIDAKQFDAARNLLATIDHPTAREWLAKLNQR